MTLKDKYCYDAQGKFWYLKISDVKEFIKELKEAINNLGNKQGYNEDFVSKFDLNPLIDKLAGEELVK